MPLHPHPPPPPPRFEISLSLWSCQNRNSACTDGGVCPSPPSRSKSSKSVPVSFQRGPVLCSPPRSPGRSRVRCRVPLRSSPETWALTRDPRSAGYVKRLQTANLHVTSGPPWALAVGRPGHILEPGRTLPSFAASHLHLAGSPSQST